jgi:hypothetical protein
MFCDRSDNDEINMTITEHLTLFTLLLSSILTHALGFFIPGLSASEKYSRIGW